MTDEELAKALLTGELNTTRMAKLKRHVKDDSQMRRVLERVEQHADADTATKTRELLEQSKR